LLDLLHHLDLEIALRDQLLQPRVLLFELLQAANVVRLKAAKPLLPGVHRLLADPVAPRHRRHRIAIRLPDDRDHLFFREPRFAHRSLQSGSQSLT